MSYRKHLRKKCHVRHNYFPSTICEQLSQIKASLKQRLQSKFICILLYLECLPTFLLAVTLRGRFFRFVSVVSKCNLNSDNRGDRWAGKLNCSFAFAQDMEQWLVVVAIYCLCFSSISISFLFFLQYPEFHLGNLSSYILCSSGGATFIPLLVVMNKGPSPAHRE